MIRRTLLIGLVVASACVPAAVSRASSPAPASLRADIAEWSLVPSAGVLRAGLVRITSRNVGLDTHQLVLVRTARFAEALPLRGDRAAVRPVAPVLTLEPGATGSIVVRLRPGNYLLIDNLPWHYWRGTSAAIVVR